MYQSFINWQIKHNIIKSEGDFVISLGIIVVIFFVVCLSLLFSNIKKRSIKDLQENSSPLFVITRDKPGVINIFATSVILFFWPTSFLQMSLKYLIFINAITLFFVLNFIDSFFANIIVKENYLKYRSLFTLFQYKILPFNKIKQVEVFYNRYPNNLTIRTYKGFLLFYNVFDADKIKSKLDDLIFTEEEKQRQKIENEKDMEKGAFLIAIIML
jgi:hypothetical protein